MSTSKRNMDALDSL